MTYLIDLNIEGSNLKMNGTIEELESKVEEIGGKNLNIFNSRSGHYDKIIQFDTSNGFHVTGHAVKA